MRERQADRQGLSLQAAQQPGLYRRSRAQGDELSRRTPADHLAGPLGQGPLDHWRKARASGQGRAGGRRRPCCKGLLFAPNGYAMTPSHTRKKGRLYRYYVTTSVQSWAGDLPGPAPSSRRDRGGSHRSAPQPASLAGDHREDLDGGARRGQRHQLRRTCATPSSSLDPLWDELFPAEQARIVQLLVERVDVDRRRHLHPAAHQGHRQRHRRACGNGQTCERPPDDLPRNQPGRLPRSPSPFRLPSESVAAASSVVSPVGAETWAPSRPRIDNTLLRAVVQAFHWKHKLESGQHATISELAEAFRNSTGRSSPMSY